MRKKSIYISLIFLCTFGFFSVSTLMNRGNDPITPRDYPAIQKEGILRAITEYNSISYQSQNDTLSGFHYELLKAFAQDKGLKIEITPAMSIKERFSGMVSGSYDILAHHMLVTQEGRDTLNYTHPILLSKQVLVQRKPADDTDSTYVKNPLGLAQKTIYVVKDAPFKLRIKNLSNEIGDTIYVKEIEKYGSEQLLALVANKDIDYMVCDEHIAKAAQKDFPDLDFSLAISFTQFYAWGVNKHSPVLLDTLNHWIDQFKETEAYSMLIKKYIHQ